MSLNTVGLMNVSSVDMIDWLNDKRGQQCTRNVWRPKGRNVWVRKKAILLEKIKAKDVVHEVIGRTSKPVV